MSPRAGKDVLASSGPAEGKRNIENLESRFADIEQNNGGRKVGGKWNASLMVMLHSEKKTLDVAMWL